MYTQRDFSLLYAFLWSAPSRRIEQRNPLNQQQRPRLRPTRPRPNCSGISKDPKKQIFFFLNKSISFPVFYFFFSSGPAAGTGAWWKGDAGCAGVPGALGPGALGSRRCRAAAPAQERHRCPPTANAAIFLLKREITLQRPPRADGALAVTGKPHPPEEHPTPGCLIPYRYSHGSGPGAEPGMAGWA